MYKLIKDDSKAGNWYKLICEATGVYIVFSHYPDPEQLEYAKEVLNSR